jgi:AcrR family transcriptional regulator
VSTAYEESGRTRQKQRTRNDLVSAARDLIARDGSAPTVEQAAAAASVSRTTAYRYFPSQHALLAAAHPEIELSSLLPVDVGDDPEVRIEAAVRGLMASVLDTEQQQRTMLRLSLEANAESHRLPLRQGRAIGWFSEALDPLADHLGKNGVRRLAVAVRAVSGIEALVWLTDVAGLTREQAVDQMAWSAVALVQRAAASLGG